MEIKRVIRGVKNKAPKLMIIYGNYKQGKSTACSLMPDTLIIDLNREYDFMSGWIMEASNIKELAEIRKSVEDMQDKPKRVVIDNTTWLVKLAMPLAESMYKETEDGKRWNGNNLMGLPYGGGYMWLKNAIEKIIEAWMRTVQTVIIVAHGKRELGKEGVEDTWTIDVPGNMLRTWLTANADTVAFMERNPEDNTCTLDFRGKKNVLCGTREPHLRNEIMIITEMKESGEIVSHWDKVFNNK